MDGKLTDLGTSVDDINDTLGNIAEGKSGVVQRTATAGVTTLTADGGTGDNPGAAQKLTNLAAGEVSATSKDAINGSQLHNASARIAAAFGGGTVVNPDGSISAPSYTVQGSIYDNVGAAVGAVDGNLTALNNAVASGTTGVVQRTATLDVTVLTADGGTGANPGAAQKLTNLAEGEVSATSKDAINGSQLFASNQRMDLIAANTSLYLGGGADVFNGIAPSYTIDGKQYASVGTAFDAVNGNLQYLDGRIDAINNSSNNGTVNGNDSVASGETAVADGNSSVAVGDGSHAVGDNSVAVGKDSTAGGNSSVAIGDNAKAEGESSVAIGKDSNAKNEGDVALGSGSVTGDAVATKDITINGKTYDVAGTDPKNTVSVGDVGSERTITNVAAGRVSDTSTDAVNGSQLYATKQAIEDLGGQVADATLTVKNAVQYDTDSDGNRLNSVTLQGTDVNAPVVLSNVAAGTKDTDAVNVKQMKDSSEQTLSQAKDYSDTRSEETLVLAKSYTETYTQDYVQKASTNTLSEAKSYTDQQFGKLSSEIGDVRKEARQAAAIGLAAASLRYDDRPGKLSAAIGGGVWRGEGAAAFGLGYTSEDQRMRANLSATTTGSSWGVGAGLSFTLN